MRFIFDDKCCYAATDEHKKRDWIILSSVANHYWFRSPSSTNLPPAPIFSKPIMKYFLKTSWLWYTIDQLSLLLYPKSSTQALKHTGELVETFKSLYLFTACADIHCIEGNQCWLNKRRTSLTGEAFLTFGECKCSGWENKHPNGFCGIAAEIDGLKWYIRIRFQVNGFVH